MMYSIIGAAVLFQFLNEVILNDLSGCATRNARMGPGTDSYLEPETSHETAHNFLVDGTVQVLYVNNVSLITNRKKRSDGKSV